MNSPGKSEIHPIKVGLFFLLIGFLMLGLLRGKAAVDASRANMLETDFHRIAHALHAYHGKFKALPGDDAEVRRHLRHAVNCAPQLYGRCQPGNDVIDGDWNAASTASESYLVWQHLRLADLLQGATDPASASYLPHNGEGGRLGVTDELHSPIIGLHGPLIICSDNIKASLARTVDAALDDGKTRSGKVMVTKEGTVSGGIALATGQLVDDEHYLVCMSTGRTSSGKTD